MKHFVTLSLMSLFIGLSTSSFAQKTVKKGPNTAEIEAGKAIRFCNSVISLGNAHIGTLQNAEDRLDVMNQNIDKVKRKQTPFYINPNISSAQERQKKEFKDVLASTKLSPELNDIANKTKEADIEIEKITQQVALISEYFATKKYTSDNNFSQCNEYGKNLEESITKAREIWSNASQSASTMGEKAELVLLKNSPIAEFVIPMKTDLNLFDAIFNVQISSSDTDLNTIKSQLANITASIEKNKTLENKNVKKLRDFYYREVYTTFYHKLEQSSDALKTLLKNMERGEKDKEVLNSHYSYANSFYNDAIERYNTFIKQ